MAEKKPLFDVVLENMSYTPPAFKQVAVGSMRLKRSVFPKEESVYEYFYLDQPSSLHLSARALSLGVTKDELLRQLVWSL